MSHVPHELPEEFPQQIEAIQALKQTNHHFARIVDDYHELNRAIHRSETNVEAMDDFELEKLKKKRLTLKDEIVRELAAHAS